MSSATLLLGSVLTFASTDGQLLQLTVSLTKPATVALSWGSLEQRTDRSLARHTFRDLPVPSGSAVEYVLSIAGEPPRTVRVDPIGTKASLRIAVYGDSRDGSAAHAILVKQMEAKGVDVVVHTGDVIRSAGDTSSWVNHLAATLPLLARRPVIFALGNHEILTQGPSEVNGLVQAMEQIPPPADLWAKQMGAPPSVFHVRVGPALFVSLDSNTSMNDGTPQMRFLDRVLAAKGDVPFAFTAYHHGPLSSGPHGPHPHASSIVSALERGGVSASLGGHDHLYERLERNDITYLVAGGGGAPLYAKARELAESRAFASTYNWALIHIRDGRAELEAYSLEGVLLDRSILRPAQGTRGESSPPASRVPAFVGLALLLFGLVWASRALR